jgi:hypothetical protein
MQVCGAAPEFGGPASKCFALLLLLVCTRVEVLPARILSPQAHITGAFSCSFSGTRVAHFFFVWVWDVVLTYFFGETTRSAQSPGLFTAQVLAQFRLQTAEMD